jgi:hypothetical protein
MFRNYLKKVWRILKSISKRDTWLLAPQSEFVFYQADSDLGEMFEGLPFGRFLGPVAIDAREKGRSFVFLSRPFSLLTDNLAWAKPYRMNRAMLAYRIFNKIGLKGLAESRIQKMATKFLNQTNPKAVLTIGADEWLCNACFQKKIPVIEVLHGRGYTQIPWGWDLLPASKLPSHVISFDPISTQTFNLLGTNDIQVIQTEDYWKKFVKKQFIQSQDTTQGYRSVVLFTLNWGYDGDHLDAAELSGILRNGLFPEFLEELILDKSLNVKWLFRLHPAQLRGESVKKYKKFLNELADNHFNVEWEQASIQPLPLILERVTHHITMSSMATYQAAEEGIKTLLLCPTLQPGRENEGLFNDLVNTNLAIKSQWEKDIVKEWIQNTTRIRRTSLSANVGSGIYETVNSLLSD